MASNLFDQFAPPSFFCLPLLVPTIFLSFIWIFFLLSPNQMPTRVFVVWSSLSLLLPPLLLRPAGPSSSPWTPFIFALFTTLLSLNVLSLSPHALAPTSHFSLTLSLALPLWIAVTVSGFRKTLSIRLSHFLPQGTPVLLIPLLVWIEFLSLLAQPLALALRLAANLTAGHLLIYLLSAAGWFLSSSRVVVSFLIFVVLFLLLLLEIAVAVIQAYVFSTLVAFYLQQNILQ